MYILDIRMCIYIYIYIYITYTYTYITSPSSTSSLGLTYVLVRAVLPAPRTARALSATWTALGSSLREEFTRLASH